MEIPSCVIDATTLVEHIHEVKSWVYNGQVQLVVPLSTYQRVEKLSQDYKEQTVKRPDPPRQRSSWKPARKEFPAFDINLRVAEEFLARLKLEEAQHYVIFQQISEEYSPWKRVDAYVEKKDSKEDGPTTWAQAALTSLHNKIHSSNIVDNPKRPPKPKLVARSSRTETSPWKTNKNAPKISPAEIPDTIRPLLSYTLWRIYENVLTRADTNPSIVLSDHFETCDAARRLNISAARVEELRHTIATQKIAVDSNVFGDLERDFGIRELKLLPSQDGDAYATSTEDNLLYQHDHPKMEDETPNEIELPGSCGEIEVEPGNTSVTTNDNDGGKTTSNHMNDEVHAKSNGHSFMEVKQPKALKDSCESLGSTEAIASSTGSEHSTSVMTEQQNLPNAEDKMWIAVDEPEVLTKQVDGLQVEESRLFTNQTNGLPKLEPEFFTDDASGFRKLDSQFFTKQTNGFNGQEPGLFTNGVDGLAMLESRFFTQEYNRSHRPEAELFAKQEHGLHTLKPEAFSKISNTCHRQEPEQSIKQANGLHGRRTRNGINAQEHVTGQSPPAASIDIAQDANNKVDPKTDNSPGTINAPGKTVIPKQIIPAHLPRPHSQPRKPAVNPPANNISKPASSRSPKVLSSIPAQVAPEPEDSDEEVVVFSPKSKRLSAQNAPPRQTNARPPIRTNHAQPTPQVKAPLIDPDAFGRSDAIGPPFTSNTRAHVQNWQYPRHPPRGSPRHVPRTNESDVDFVLKSGAPRGASRGQGKLWVP